MGTGNEFQNSNPPLAMTAEEFSKAGHRLIDIIAGFLDELPNKPVTTAEQPSQIRSLLGGAGLPEEGRPAEQLLDGAAQLLFNHSLFNGHPGFWGYITSSAAPIGALADLLAAAVNPNVGAYALSPVATEIERQAIQWLAEFIGYPAGSSGLFVSGGNMANFIGFLAARRAKSGWDIRKEGLKGNGRGMIPGQDSMDAGNMTHNQTLLVYCSKGTHTWIQKAADLFGLGTDAIRWIDMDDKLRIDTGKLVQQIKEDLSKGFKPFLVVGIAGSVSTGSIDPLEELSVICKTYDLWFHVDGAYGAPAAVLPELENEFKGLSSADSVAIDPHKWLYSPLEAGCLLIRNAKLLTDAFSFHPDYYNFDGSEEDPAINYYDYGLQNSRGFRALKVWLGLQQAGRKGYVEMIRKNIQLAVQLFWMVGAEPELEAMSQSLSITTFRYRPADLKDDTENETRYLNELNEQVLNSIQAGGKVYLSNAVIDNHYCLRVCIVNFRTQLEDLKNLVEIVLSEGRKLDGVLRERFYRPGLKMDNARL